MTDRVLLKGFRFHQNMLTKNHLRSISHSPIIYLNHVNVSY
jgi:hypothetical protein